MVSTMFTGQAGGTAQQAATAVSFFWNSVKNRINSGYTMLVEALVYEIDIPTGDATAVHQTTNTPVAGGQGTDPVNGFTQGLISWHTGFFIAGRELVGKTFIPGVSEGDTAAGIPSSTYLSDLASAATAYLASANATPTVYSRAHHSSVGIAGFRVAPTWSVLKSRR
jgi:hypothetical protein